MTASAGDNSFAGRVGIVLVNYNGMKFIPECLESLARNDYSNATIVVVDNASADGSADWIAANYTHVALVRHTDNRGITGGNNAGIGWCLENGCDYVLLLNNDTVVEPNFLTHLMAQTEDDCLLVPKIYFYDDKTRLNNHIGGYDYWRGLHTDWFYRQPDSAASREIRFAKMANTCALLVPIKVFEKIGRMDDAYFMYSDDTDFLTRAVRAGFRIKFVPESVLYHRESSSSGGRTSPLSVYYTNRNRLYLMFKHQRNYLALAFFVLYFTASRIVTAATYLRHGQRAQLAALCNAILDFRSCRMGYAPQCRFQAGNPGANRS